MILKLLFQPNLKQKTVITPTDFIAGISVGAVTALNTAHNRRRCRLCKGLCHF